MVSLFLPVVSTLLVFTALCNAFCEISYEDVYAVDCTYSDLTDVPTSEIPDDVESLDLSNNKLTKLKRSDWIYYTSLETLYFTANTIFTIEHDAFSDLKNLTNLDLSSNKLRYIPPEVFVSNSALETVNLRGNPELYVASNSPFLISLSLASLDLSSCRLTSLDSETFSQIPGLVYLDIRYNELTLVNLKTFEFLEELDTLDLRNNKWNCDCQIVDVLNWVSNRRTSQGLRIQHSPVKCLDKGIYKPLWNAARLNEPCQMTHISADSLTTKGNHIAETAALTIELKATTQGIRNEKPKKNIVETNQKLTSQISQVNIKEISNLEIEDISDNVDSSNGLQEFFESNFNMLLIFVLILLLGVSTFVAVFAATRCTEWLDSRSNRHRISKLRLLTSSPYNKFPDRESNHDIG